MGGVEASTIIENDLDKVISKDIIKPHKKYGISNK